MKQFFKANSQYLWIIITANLIYIFSPVNCFTPSSSEESVCACPLIRQPVCGVDGKNYDTPCLARCARTTVTYSGRCKHFSPRTSKIKPFAGRTCNCPKIYNPVCGFNRKTYSNACLAKCSGTGVWQRRPCNPVEYSARKNSANTGLSGRSSANFYGLRPTFLGSRKSEVCACEPYHLPVCGTDWKTYKNVCYARCSGVGILFPRACF